MGSLFMGLTINNIIRMLAGKRYYGDGTEDDDESKHVRDLIAEVVTTGGAGNAADYFPILCWLTDYEKRVKKLGARVDEFLQSLVDDKRAEKVKGNTMIDRLLSLQETQPEYYTDVIIKGIIVERGERGLNHFSDPSSLPVARQMDLTLLLLGITNLSFDPVV